MIRKIGEMFQRTGDCNFPFDTFEIRTDLPGLGNAETTGRLGWPRLVRRGTDGVDVAQLVYAGRQQGAETFHLITFGTDKRDPLFIVASEQAPGLFGLYLDPDDQPAAAAILEAIGGAV